MYVLYKKRLTEIADYREKNILNKNHNVWYIVKINTENKNKNKAKNKPYCRKFSAVVLLKYRLLFQTNKNMIFYYF